MHEASTQGIEATSANLFRKECLGMQRSPKAMLLSMFIPRTSRRDGAEVVRRGRARWGDSRP